MTDKPAGNNGLALSKTSLEFDTVRLIADIRASKATEKPSLRDMEAVSGISASTFSRIDNGNKPDMDTFIQLCETFSLEPGNYFLWIEWTGVIKANSNG